MVILQLMMIDSLSIFDPNEALDRIGGDEDLLREMIDIFAHVLNDDMDKLERSIKAGDPESIRKNAHRLKGSIGNFGMNRAYHAAYAVEQGSSCPKEEIEVLFLNLKSEVYELKRALTKYAFGS